jgi:uncharacterized delta-60 repeat protein
LLTVLIVSRAGAPSTAACVVLTALAGLLATGSPAAADSMAIQPDGRILLTGDMWPSFAAIARVNPDGSLDPSFGQGGFVVDRRLPDLRSLALQADGRILAGAVEGFQLGHYLPDGAPDPEFGVGGTRDPAQSDSLYSDYGPETILPRPQGDIVVGGTQKLARSEEPGAIVRRYDAHGSFLETVGEVRRPGGRLTAGSHLRGLLAQPDGSLVGAGLTYLAGNFEKGSRVLLARFIPSSGSRYDAGFGGGQGLVTATFPSQDPYASNWGLALARQGSAFLVAGTSDDTFLLTRFNAEGLLDQSFAGGAGAARPPIVGTSGKDGSSSARAIAVQGDGRIVLAGETTRWGTWGILGKLLYGCSAGCPQPMLARFSADGQLDPSFGSGGLLRLLRPNGDVLEGQVEQLAALADGKLLVKGKVEHGEPDRNASPAFLARLNGDGSYDPSFGEGGLTILNFPCTSTSQAVLEQEGCLAHALVKLGVSGVAAGRPRLSLRVRPDVPWARIRDVLLTLPKSLRPTRRLGERSRAVATSGGKARHFRVPGPSLTKKGRLAFSERRLPIGLSARLLPGALRVVGKPAKRRTLVFRVNVSFVHGERFAPVGRPTVVLRRHGG